MIFIVEAYPKVGKTIGVTITIDDIFRLPTPSKYVSLVARYICVRSLNYSFRFYQIGFLICPLSMPHNVTFDCNCTVNSLDSYYQSNTSNLPVTGTYGMQLGYRPPSLGCYHLTFDSTLNVKNIREIVAMTYHGNVTDTWTLQIFDKNTDPLAILNKSAPENVISLIYSNSDLEDDDIVNLKHFLFTVDDVELTLTNDTGLIIVVTGVDKQGKLAKSWMKYWGLFQRWNQITSIQTKHLQFELNEPNYPGNLSAFDFGVQLASYIGEGIQETTSNEVSTSTILTVSMSFSVLFVNV